MRLRVNGGQQAPVRRAAAAMMPLLVLLAAGACGGKTVPGAGADPAQAGPQGTPTAIVVEPPAAGAPGAGNPTGSPGPDQVELLERRLVDALRRTDPKTHAGSLTVEQLPAAGNQLVVTWTITSSATDRTARQRVRTNITEVLGVVKRSTLSYGSVLVIVHGTVRGTGGSETDAQVVRAKYSRALVKRTDFGAVSPDRILKMPDDKPAEIHPAYR
ncbi:MAG TPA: hypothetical protein VFR67_16980 [Pilimelia sp.]|nr:hypothetical protein [Pilimelia sp.]